MKFAIEQFYESNNFADALVAELGSTQLHIDLGLLHNYLLQSIISPHYESCPGRLIINEGAIRVVDQVGNYMSCPDIINEEVLDVSTDTLRSIADYLQKSHYCPCSDL